MAVMNVPPIESAEEGWPSLGGQVVRWIEDHAVYGPGDVQGQEYKVTPDFEAQLWRAYEVYPHDHRLAGRRRFKRVYLEERKGTAKTERAMVVALVESHPDAPARVDHWERDRGELVPVARGVQHPYIPLVSYTVEQTEDLGFFVLRSIIENGRGDLPDRYDIGLERIVVLGERGEEAGKIVPLAGSPNARDGARTTWQHFDEPHRMSLARLVKAHSTMLENTYKRRTADAWTLYTSTAGEPGEGSVAEGVREYAEGIDAGKHADPALFFFSRYTPLTHPLETPDDVRDALLEASGPNASWSGDIDGLVGRYFEPKTDRNYYRRVWLNQWTQGGTRAFDVERWRRPVDDGGLAIPGASIEPRSVVAIGFDGARRRDATGYVITDLATGLQVVGHAQERPEHASDEWEVDARALNNALEDTFSTYVVALMYGDPPYWDDWMDAWEGRWPGRVKRWWTNRDRAMAYALKSFQEAQVNGVVRNNGDPLLAAHVGNAVRKSLDNMIDEDTQQPAWLIRKERPNSPKKIDLAMAATLSWEARGDAIASGALKRRGAQAVFL